MKNISSLLAFLFLSGTTLWAQQFPQQPEPWQDAYNIDVTNVEFTHPITVFNATERDTILERIANQKEPQFTTFQQLMDEADEMLSYIPEPPSTMDIMGGYENDSNLPEMRAILWSNSYTAYTLALAYNLSGDEQYAAKAEEIMMAWANTGTTFTGNDRGLQLGSYFNSMLYAVDLLHDYDQWEESEREVFKDWWINECLDSGDVIGVMRRKDNNWKDAAILGVITAAVVFEDSLLLKESVIQLTSYFYERTDENVVHPGTSWKFSNDELGTYMLREVVRNEGRSGLTYTAYALTTMVQAMEIAHNAGFSLWDKETAEGANMQKIVQQYFDWTILNESFPWNGNPNKTPYRRNAFEVANNHFEMSEIFQSWLSFNRPVNGEQGDAWTTLTKGLTGETNIGGTDTLDFESIYLEAEDADVEMPMVIQDDLLSSNGQYVFVPEGNRSTGSVPEAGKTTFNVYLKGGNYRIWARVIAPNPESDSYWIQINDQPAFFWNQITNSDSWIWVPVHQNNDEETPWNFSVEEEEYSISFHYREDHAQLDMIFISNDGSTPSDDDAEVILPQMYLLTLLSDPPGAGYVFGTGEYPAGYNVEISASPGPNFAFEGWTDEEGNEVNPANDELITMPQHDLTLTANFQSTVNVNDQSAITSGILVYPNPGNGQFTLELSNGRKGMVGVEVMNMTGQRIYTKEFEYSGFLKEKIDISGHGNGIYFMVIRNDDQVGIERVIIQ